ncbi:hypothetical protein Patl1_34983 [Pistacia atlantica]|uniref:Uncharacterized protein n=1 Tax=Pistacia atlantica TaxID=434234 RepID=A0ACC0ZT04_9ROSI|nr:hypothetical protein Patl1_34983 [Pistacia atlantica]
MPKVADSLPTYQSSTLYAYCFSFEWLDFWFLVKLLL